MGEIPVPTPAAAAGVTSWRVRARALALPRSEYRRDALFTSATSVGLYAIGFVTGPIVARALGPAGRGEIAAVIGPATVLVLVLAFGLPTAAAYFVDSVPERKLLTAATAFGLVVGLPVCALLWVLVPGFLSGHSPTTVAWARIVLVGAPLSVGMGAALEVQRRLHPGPRWNAWRSAPIVLPAVATIVLALTGRLTLGAFFAAGFAGSLIPLALLLSRLRGDRLERPSLGVLRLMLPYAWRTASISTAMSLTARLDQVVLVGLVGPAELGLYAVAVMVASVTSPLTSGMSSALFGHLRGDPEPVRAHSRFRRSLLATAVVSGCAAVAIGIVAPALLRAVFGSTFEPAAAALRLLLPGAVALDVLGVLTTKLFSEGRPGLASQAALIGAFLTVAGLVWLAPRYGIEGAAAVTSAAWGCQVLFLLARGAAAASPAGPARPSRVPERAA